MVGAIAISVDSSLKQDELVRPISLCFLKKDLEEQYQDYQFEIARNSLAGRWGALSISWMVLCINNASAYIQQIATSVSVITPGTIERMIVRVPMTLFVFYYQSLVHKETFWDKKACRSFVVQLTL